MSTPEHVDVLIVGAGLSGIGAACQLKTAHPDRSLALLEAREASGGTWDLFRYPGIRSDSDMFTFGYKWRPWPSETALADGHTILDYVRTVAEEYGVDKLIRYRYRVTSAAWSSETARWTVGIEHDGKDQLWTFTGWRLVDLSTLRVRLKAEFQASNAELYRKTELSPPQSGR